MNLKTVRFLLGSPRINKNLIKRFSSVNGHKKLKGYHEGPSVSGRSKLSSGNIPGTIQSDFSLMIPIFSRLTQLSEPELRVYFDKTVEAHNKLITHLGVQYGTKHYKDIVLYCLLLIEGRNPPKVNRVSTGKKDGWPKIFGHLRPIYHSITPNRYGKVKDSKEVCVEKLRLLQTLFKLNRVCASFAEIDVSNIKSTFDLPKEFVSRYDSYLNERYGDTEPINPDHFVIRGFLGSKRGPNSVPKIESAKAEAAKLLRSKEHHHFKVICELTDNMKFYEYFHEHAMEFEAENPGFDHSKTRLRKLVAVPDKANKSRTVAICDIWTQMLLEPFEEFLKARMLKEFPTSSAYLNHAGGFEKLKLTATKEHVSIDASQWTDNFPSHLQYLTVKKLLGQEYATAWQALAIKCKWHVGSSDHTITYGKGQGMGTKGSFMAASFSDHNVIECTYLSHYQEVLDYQKVGDDLVVQDPDNIFESMYNSIGVPVNVSKSKFATSRGHFLEFVSRNMWDGKDYSILSPNVLAKALKQPYIYPVLVQHLAERIPLDAIPSLDEIFRYTPPGKDTLRFDKHKASVERLVSIYASLSGDNFIKVENPKVFLNTGRLLLAIIQEILRMEKLYLHRRLHSDNIEKYEDMVSEFINDEYTDRWVYFIDKSVSLKEIESFNFSYRVFRLLEDIGEASLQQGQIFSPMREAHPHQYTNPNVSPTYRLSITKLLLECLMVVKCKVENIQIIDSLDSLNPKNSEPKVQLLKGLNTCIKISESKEFEAEIGPKDAMMLSTLNLNTIYSQIRRSVDEVPGSS